MKLQRDHPGIPIVLHLPNRSKRSGNSLLPSGSLAYPVLLGKGTSSSNLENIEGEWLCVRCDHYNPSPPAAGGGDVNSKMKSLCQNFREWSVFVLGIGLHSHSDREFLMGTRFSEYGGEDNQAPNFFPLQMPCGLCLQPGSPKDGWTAGQQSLLCGHVSSSSIMSDIQLLASDNSSKTNCVRVHICMSVLVCEWESICTVTHM